MIAYIPKADCQEIEQDILDRLNNNKLISEIVINSTEEFYPREDKRRYLVIAKNKLQIYKKAIKKGDKFFLTCNSNTMYTLIKLVNPVNYLKVHFIDKIELLLDHMKDFKNCGLAAYTPYRTYPRPYHIAEGFSLIRTEAAKCVSFNMLPGMKCECFSVRKEMNENNWDVRYVSDFHDLNRVNQEQLKLKTITINKGAKNGK